MFRTKKTREAISFILEALGGTSTYGVVTKLLYIADRESLRQQGRTITGDTMCALPHGPILSVVLDRLNGSHSDFGDLVTYGPNAQISLLREEAPNDLTFTDLSILREVLSRYGQMSWDALKAETHRFPEWAKHDRGLDTWSLIGVEDVADALGLSQEQKAALVRNIEERDSVFAVLQSLAEKPRAAV